MQLKEDVAKLEKNIADLKKQNSLLLILYEMVRKRNASGDLVFNCEEMRVLLTEIDTNLADMEDGICADEEKEEDEDENDSESERCASEFGAEYIYKSGGADDYSGKGEERQQDSEADEDNETEK